MVFYREQKRQPRRATDGKITDLADELLLSILDHVDPLDVLRFRVTCRTFAPAGTSAITRRMKKLYVSPSRSSLLAAIDICGHPAFASAIEEVVVLGCCPQFEKKSYRSGPDLELRRGRDDYLTTWPTTFPTARKVATLNEEAPISGHSFHNVYKPLLDALSTLPRLKRLSFNERFIQQMAQEARRPRLRPVPGYNLWNAWLPLMPLLPGFNQVSASALDNFQYRHTGKASARDKRWSDGYVMLAILSALGTQIQEFEFRQIFALTYRDLLDAEAEFAPHLLESVEDDALGLDELTLLVSKIEPRFPVSKGSFLHEVRHHSWGDKPMRYLQTNGEQAEVRMTCSRVAWYEKAIGLF